VNNVDYTRYRVRPGKAFSLRDVNPEDTQDHPGKKRARKQLSANLELVPRSLALALRVGGRSAVCRGSVGPQREQ